MSEDRKLLELAAKAAGFDEFVWIGWEPHQWMRVRAAREWSDWNPLANDGDALRLLVKVGLSLDTKGETSFAHPYNRSHEGAEIAHLMDALAATRRAIVLAAAEIGESA